MLNHRSNLSQETFFKKNDTAGFIYGLEEAVTQAAVLGVIIIFGVVGNIYICSVVYKTKNLRNPTFIFLVNLAIANIGALTLCTPFPLLVSIRRRFVLENHWCILNGFLNNFFFCVSIFTLSLIAAQNYFTVVKPPSCEWLQITKKRAKYHVAGIWILCFAFSLLSLGPFESWSYVAFNPTTAHCGIAFPDSIGDKIKLTSLALVAFIIPVAGMCYAYGRIYLKVRQHQGKVNRSKKSKNSRVSAVTKKLAVTLCLVFGTFVVCWLPFFLLITMAVVLDEVSTLPWSLGRIAYWSGYLNCAINPSLYCLRSSAFIDVIRRRSSSSGLDATANKYPPCEKRRRAFSLPVISANFKRPLLRLERQSYPNTGREVNISMPGLWGSEEVLQTARLRAYSCSSYGITDQENNDIKGAEKNAREKGRNLNGDDFGVLFSDETMKGSDRVFSQSYDRDTMSSFITLRGNSLGQQSPTGMMESINIKLDELTTHV